MTDKKGWRYQPVWAEHNGEKVYSLCEVYFDGDGRLEHWTESPAMLPQGIGDVQELRGDLTRMLMDAYKWEAVEFKTLAPGMSFRRAVTQEQMEDIARMVEAVNEAAKAAIMKVN